MYGGYATGSKVAYPTLLKLKASRGGGKGKIRLARQGTY